MPHSIDQSLIQSRRSLAGPPAEPSSPDDRLAALSTIPELDGLPEDQLTWLARNSTERIGPDGTVFFSQDETSHHLNIILRGEILVNRRHNGPNARFMGRTARVTGKLPYSRMGKWGGEGCAAGDAWVLDL